jgi:hypothetical protein
MIEMGFELVAARCYDHTGPLVRPAGRDVPMIMLHRNMDKNDGKTDGFRNLSSSIELWQPTDHGWTQPGSRAVACGLRKR